MEVYECRLLYATYVGSTYSEILKIKLKFTFNVSIKLH